MRQISGGAVGDDDHADLGAHDIAYESVRELGDETVDGHVDGHEAVVDEPIDVDPAARRRTFVQAIGIVAAGLAAVAMSAIVLERRSDANAGASFGTLAAPVTDVDRDRAELARRVRDAVLIVDAGPDADRGGFRSSGRGWVFGNPRNHDDDSLLVSLSSRLDDGFSDLAGSLGLDDDVLVHACGDAVGVFVRSSVQIDVADEAFWESNDCPTVPFWVIGQPTFFVVGVVDDA